MIDGLIGTARRLAGSGVKGKPRQSDLRRAVSTAYYALFHALAKDGADLFVGASRTPSAAWSQAYRALEHGFAKNACSQVRGLGLPGPIVGCAETFVRLQQQRHAADYDPLARFTRTEVILAVDEADKAVRDLRSSGRADRRAFAVLIRLKAR